MYQSGGVVLGASTTAAGIAVLPQTGERNLLTYAAVTAVAVGVVTVALHIAAAVYRRTARTK